MHHPQLSLFFSDSGQAHLWGQRFPGPSEENHRGARLPSSRGREAVVQMWGEGTGGTTQNKIRERTCITVDKTQMIIYDYVISMSISYNIVFQVLRWWSCSSWLHSKKHFTRPYSSQPNGYGYAISHYSWKGSFWITNSVDAHLMREHQTEVLKHFHPPGSSSVSSWGFFLVRPPVFLALL